MASAYCKKCDIKHPRPVGRNCRRQPTVEPEAPTTAQAETSQGVSSIDIAAIASLVTAQVSSQITDVVQAQLAKHAQPTQQVTSDQAIAEMSNITHQQCTPALLRGDNNIQSAVTQRMQQLEAATAQEFASHGKPVIKIKPGRERVPGHEGVVHNIRWPHELVYVGPQLKQVKYDEMNQSQFSAGLLSMANNETDPDIQKAMLAYITELHHDMITIGFPATLSINSSVLSEIENGKLAWHEYKKIDHIKQKYILNAAIEASQMPKLNESRGSQARNNNYSNNSNDRFSPCSNFNLGKCPFQWPHRENGIMSKHICSYCFSRGNHNTNHPEVQCRQKSARPPPV